MKSYLKKSLFIIAILILIFPLAYATNIAVSVIPIQDKVAPLQEAIYKVQITNSETLPVIMDFKYLDIYWILEPSSVIVESKTVKNVELKLIPQYEEKPNIIELIIESRDKTFRSTELLKPTLLGYDELVKPEILMSEAIDPRKTNTIKLRLINQHNNKLENLNVLLKSEFFEKTTTISLEPYETKTESFEIVFDKNVIEGDYPLDLKITWGEKTLIDKTETIRIGQYPSIKEIKSPESGFLYTKLEISKTNEGNTISHELYSKKMSWFAKTFTKTSPQPSSITKQVDGYSLTWKFELNPGENKTIIVETSYRWFFVIVIIIIAVIIFLWYYLKIDLILKKKVTDIRTSTEGYSSMKIVLTLKNKGKTLRNVKLMDRLINIAETPKEFGTAHPKVHKTPTGVNLIWHIDQIGKSEERIFSYRAKSNIQVIGELKVPTAVARYKVGTRNKIVKSNRVRLFS